MPGFRFAPFQQGAVENVVNDLPFESWEFCAKFGSQGLVS
jgi:hypothetical protein